MLAERQALLDSRGEPPLLLLDDVMSELDADRRRRLAELLRSGGQAVVTATEPEHVPGTGEPGVAVIEVAGGELVPGVAA
jgi:DNA replication and repair protein RecF